MQKILQECTVTQNNTLYQNKICAVFLNIIITKSNQIQHFTPHISKPQVGPARGKRTAQRSFAVMGLWRTENLKKKRRTQILASYSNFITSTKQNKSPQKVFTQETRLLPSIFPSYWIKQKLLLVYISGYIFNQKSLTIYITLLLFIVTKD